MTPAAFALHTCPPRRILGLCRIALAGLCLLTGCEAKHAHNEVFFACSADRPACPEGQSCNLNDGCCHLDGKDPSQSLGQCRLFPGLGTGSGVPSGSGIPSDTGGGSAEASPAASDKSSDPDLARGS